MLPIIENLSDPSDPNHVEEEFNINELSQLEKLVREHIEADCHAVVVNNEVLFNSYRTDQTYRERIIDFTIRSELANSPRRHLLLPLMNNGGYGERDILIELYMFALTNHPWKLCIRFDSSTEKFVARTYVCLE
jgi:hypothetical protein